MISVLNNLFICVAHNTFISYAIADGSTTISHMILNICKQNQIKFKQAFENDKIVMVIPKRYIILEYFFYGEHFIWNFQ